MLGGKAMTDLSISQEFLLCSLNEKGKLPLIGKEVPACILAGGLIELLVGGAIRMDEKNTIQTAGGLGGRQACLKSLYDWLHESKPMKLETIARAYCITLTEKRLNMLVVDIGNSLAETGCVTVEEGGVLAAKPRFVPHPDAVDRVIQKIRAEMLEDGPMADETVALVSLLEKSYRIKRYFSSYEAKQLKARLRQIREAPANRMVKQMVEYVDRMVAVIAVVASAH
jgi:hypothetical protein